MVNGARACRGDLRTGTGRQVKMEADTAGLDAPLQLYSPPAVKSAELKLGQVVTCVVRGKVKAVNSTRIVGYSVDLGAEEPAMVPSGQVTLKPNATVGRDGKTYPFIRNGWADLPVGAVLEGQVMAIGETGVNVSLARLAMNQAWTRVAQLAAEDLTLGAKVLRYSDAGATLDTEGLPAFLPWSHWSLPPGQRTRKLFGTTLPVKFLEVDKQRRRLVVSHRRALLENGPTLEPGTMVEGSVKGVKDFGAIIALDDGFEGLLHVSQVSQVFVSSPADCLKEGDRVRCVIIRVDPEDGSIALSTKMLEERPGEMVKNASAVFERAAMKAADAAKDASL